MIVDKEINAVDCSYIDTLDSQIDISAIAIEPKLNFFAKRQLALKIISASRDGIHNLNI